MAREVERLKSTWVNPHLLEDGEAVRVLGQSIEREYTLADLLTRPHTTYAGLATLRRADGSNVGGPAVADAAVAEQVEISIKYAGYIARQEDEVARLESQETTRIPASFDYEDVRGLSFEVSQKLREQRPETIGQASRISGVTPAAISLLLVHLKRRGNVGAKDALRRNLLDTLQPHRLQKDPGAPVNADAITSAAAELGLRLSGSQSDALARYAALLMRWNAVHNLTAIETPAHVLTHHLLDSLAIVPEIQRIAGERLLNVLDVGAGGGLPGIALAIAVPNLQVTLVDKVQKKIAFLTQAKVELCIGQR